MTKCNSLKKWALKVNIKTQKEQLDQNNSVLTCQLLACQLLQ